MIRRFKHCKKPNKLPTLQLFWRYVPVSKSRLIPNPSPRTLTPLFSDVPQIYDPYIGLSSNYCCTKNPTIYPPFTSMSNNKQTTNQTNKQTKESQKKKKKTTSNHERLSTTVLFCTSDVLNNIQDFIKHTWPEHVDFVSLTNALKSVQDIQPIVVVNQSILRNYNS